MEQNQDGFSAIVKLEATHSDACQHVATAAFGPESHSPPSTKVRSKDAASVDHVYLLNL